MCSFRNQHFELSAIISRFKWQNKSSISILAKPAETTLIQQMLYVFILTYTCEYSSCFPHIEPKKQNPKLKQLLNTREKMELILRKHVSLKPKTLVLNLHYSQSTIPFQSKSYCNGGERIKTIYNLSLYVQVFKQISYKLMIPDHVSMLL